MENWYFDLEYCIQEIKEYNDFLRKNTNTRKYQLETVEEFLKKPLIYVPRKYIGDLAELSAKLPPHKLINEEKKPTYPNGSMMRNLWFISLLEKITFISMPSFGQGYLQDYRFPKGKYRIVSEQIRLMTEKTVLDYERYMYKHEFHRISYVLDDFIRGVNKHLVNNVKIADATNNAEFRKQLVIDCFYACKVMAILIHPIAPEGCEMFREYLNWGEEL